jgi:hypothetical protein
MSGSDDGVAIPSEANTLQVVDGVGHFHLRGDWRFHQVVRAVSTVITQADQLGLSRLMLVSIEATGFEPPSMADRHFMAREWAQASMGHVAIAMVVPAAFIDPDRFGVVAAGNFGTHANVFTNEHEALAWLAELG